MNFTCRSLASDCRGDVEFNRFMAGQVIFASLQPAPGASAIIPEAHPFLIHGVCAFLP